MDVFDNLTTILAWLYLYLLFNVIMGMLLYSQVAGAILDDDLADHENERWKSPYYFHNWQVKSVLDPALVIREPGDFFLLRTNDASMYGAAGDDRRWNGGFEVHARSDDTTSQKDSASSKEGNKKRENRRAQPWKGPPALLYPNPVPQVRRPYTEPPILSYTTFEEDGGMYDRLEDIRKSKTWSIEHKTVISDREIEDKLLEMYLEHIFEEACEAYEAVDVERASFNATLARDLLLGVGVCDGEHREAVERFAGEEVQKARTGLLRIQVGLEATLVDCALDMGIREDERDQASYIEKLITELSRESEKPVNTKLRSELRAYSTMLDNFRLLEQRNALEAEMVREHSKLKSWRATEIGESLRLLQGGHVEFAKDEEQKGRRTDFRSRAINIVTTLVTPVLD